MPLERGVLRYVQAELQIQEAEPADWTGPEELPARPDLVLRQGDDVYVIEVEADRPDIQTVGQLALYRDLVARAEGLDEDQVKVVLAAKNVPAGVREALETVDGLVLELPPHLELGATRSTAPLGKAQVTTPKAWQVICTLLARPAPSINQLHERADVSYGWTHRTVRSLEGLGVLDREGGLLTVTDQSKLFNGVAWERPTGSLEAATLATGFESVEQGGRELTRALDRSGTTFAFTAHTAGALYTGYAFRSDTGYLYAEDPEMVRDLVGEGDGEGPTLVLYEPDRPLEETETVEGIRLASRCQVLLDLAGMGPKARDMTRAMVNDLA